MPISTDNIEYAKKLKSLIEQHPEMSMIQVAVALGKSVKWINDRLSLLNLSEENQKQLCQDKISLKEAYKLAQAKDL